MVIKRDELKYIISGGNSDIWKYIRNNQEYAFKTFCANRYSYSLKYDIYEKMQNLPLKNIICTLECYKKMSNTSEKGIDAYLMKYIYTYPEFSMLDYPVSALIESVSNLDSDTEVLSDAHILMHDVSPRNSIVSSDDLMLNIIDTDMYFYEKIVRIVMRYVEIRK